MTSPVAIADRAACEAMDQLDTLAPMRDRFDMPAGVVYLDGNSLGPLPRAVKARLTRVIDDEWGGGLIRSWTAAGWIDLPAAIGARIAPLIGAEPDEVVVTDSTSINLFKLLAAALHMRPERSVILSEEGNFPTDLYMAQGLRDLLGGTHTLRTPAADDVVDAIDSDVAVVMLTHVNYRSGSMFNMGEVTAAARRAGSLMLWDLSHSAGAVPVDLSASAADMAVGCGYKYLNGGPGAPAFAFVRRGLQAELDQPLRGWLGHAAPFEFDPSYRPAAGIDRLRCGTPPILSLTALDEAMVLWADVDMAALRAKSIALCELLIARVEATCADHGLELVSPREPERRGSQVCFAHEQAYAFVQALIARGVIGDFRTPNIMRFGIAPLYLRYVDMWDAAQELADVMATAAWDRPEFMERGAVT